VIDCVRNRVMHGALPSNECPGIHFGVPFDALDDLHTAASSVGWMAAA